MISRLTTAAAATGILALMTSTAYAGCNNAMYCNSGNHGHNAYKAAPASYGSVTLPGTHNYSMAYGSSNSVTLPGTHNYSSGYAMSDSAADAKYGTGSISGAYVDHSSVGSAYTSGTITGVTMPGLGVNERLVATSCTDGINVHGADGKQVLGCYKIAQPVQVQNYVRVVRPIVYVRYPVPVPVVTPCAPTHHWGARRCGW